MKINATEQQQVNFCDRMLGTSDSVESLITEGDNNEYGIKTYEEAYEILAEGNIERCPECDWWVEAGELASGGVCAVCEPFDTADEEDEDDY